MWKRKPPLIDAANASRGVSGWVRRLHDVFDAIRLPVVELLGGGVFRRTQTGPDGSACFETGVTRAAWARVEASDGHVIIAVHGTGDGDTSDEVSPEKARWWQEGSEFQGRVITSEAGCDATWLPFHWHGGNSDRKRHDGARKLAELCGALASRGRTYSLIGHSHGGNVIDYAFGRYSFAAGSPNACTAITSYGSPFFSAGFKPSLWGRYLVLLLLMFAATLTIHWYFSIKSNYILGITDEFKALMQIAQGKKIDIYEEFVSLIYLSTMPFSVYLLAVAGKGLYEITHPLSALGGWRRKADKHWLCVTLSRDEVLGLLPKVGGKKLTFLNTGNAKAMLQRFATFIGSAAFVLVILASMIYGVLDTNRILSIDTLYVFEVANSEPNSSTIYNISFPFFVPHGLGYTVSIIVGSLLLFLTYHLVVLLGRWTFVPLFTASMNATVSGTLKASIYGDDHDYTLKGVQFVPHYLAGRLMRIDNRTPGNLNATTAATVTEAVYEGVIGFESAEKVVSDPQALMATLMDAIYHNAYFDDTELTQLAICHIAESRASGKAA